MAPVQWCTGFIIFSVCQAGVDQCGSGAGSTTEILNNTGRLRGYVRFGLTDLLLRLLHGTTGTAEPAVVAIIIGFRAIITNEVRNPCCIDHKDVELS